ncbi:hypothetical protein PHISP_02143, partial [Aspergillus sp. HF37]
MQTQQKEDPNKTPLILPGRDNGDPNLEHPSHPQLWTPPILHSTVLVAFAALFAVLLAVIEVLFRVSNENQGLGTSVPGYHYLWTYGPTAVFILIAGFWGQVEYRAMQLMPWKAMLTREKAQASQTVLLDYITDWNVVAMVRATRNRHWAVCVAVLGSLLVALLTVLSTGLLMLQSVVLDWTGVGMSAQKAFSGAGYQSGRVDGLAALVVAGVRGFEMPYPVGTTGGYAFPVFNASLGAAGSDAVVSGPVDLFSADLDCEVATVSNWTQGCAAESLFSDGCSISRLNLVLSSESCSTHRFPSFEEYTDTVARGIYMADVFDASCANSDLTSEVDKTRLVFAAAHWTENSTRVQSLLCKPTYSISKGLVTLLNRNQSVVSVQAALDDDQTSQNTGIPGIGPLDISAGLQSSLAAVRYPMRTIALPYYLDRNISAFYQIANMSSPHAMEDLFDAAVLEDVSRETYTSMAAQVASRYLMVSADRQFEGEYSATAKRVMVRELSARFMEAALAALVILSAAMWAWRPVRSTPRDPGTISGLATILSRSGSLSERLVGVQNKGDLKAALARGLFVSQVSDKEGQRTFSIEPKYRAGEETRPKGSSDPNSPWWKPISKGWQFVSVALPVLIIIGLEITFQCSRRREGLADITSNSYIRYTWVYVPALVMILVHIFFKGIHFSTMIIQPYLELKRGATTAGSIMENHLSKLTMHSFWSALSKRKFALSASALSVILAPALRVAVSGLYSTEDVNDLRPVSIIPRDSLTSDQDINITGGKNIYGLGLTGGLVVAANMSYPPWTYGEVIVPSLREESLTDREDNVPYQPSNERSDDLSVLRLTLPALRARLECDTLAEDVIHVVTNSSDNPTSWHLSVDLGDKCSVRANHTINKPPGHRNTTDTPFGLFSDKMAAAWDCPWMTGLYGVLTTASDSASAIRGFTCQPHVQKVDVNATFVYPGLEITSISANESTTRPGPRTGFSSNIKHFLPKPTDDQNAVFDTFFSAMLRDQHTLRVSDIETLAPVPVVLNATEHLYRVLMAQGLNGVSRNASADLAPYNGTMVDRTRVRLVQSVVSTRILEACLAAMAVCTVFVVCSVRTRGVLPVNPCSIAGAAMPLADSDLLKEDVFPAGSEWCSDR